MATGVAPRVLPVEAIRVGPRRRPLDPEKVRQLAESIALLGLQQPIRVTEDRALVFGHHRLEACRRLGWPEIPCTVATDDEGLAALAEIDENLIRNDLTVLERAQHLVAREALLKELGLRAPPHRPGKGVSADTLSTTLVTTADLARGIGVGERTAQRLKQIAKRVVPEVQDAIAGTDAADNQDDLLALSRLTPPLQAQVAERLQKQPYLAVSTAVRDFHRAEVAYGMSRRAATVAVVDGVVEGDFREVGSDVLPDESVDLIFVDPPYTAEGVPLYRDLGAFAARVLRPSGLLMAYAGQAHLMKIGALLDGTEGLDYLWMCCLHRQGWVRMESARVYTQWRPLLLFYKEPRQLWWEMFADVVRSPKEKDGSWHWQQSTGEAEQLVGHFAPPGALVVDPMCGSGTTLVAAKRLGRRFLGIEVDAGRAALARERLAGVAPETEGLSASAEPGEAAG